MTCVNYTHKQLTNLRTYFFNQLFTKGRTRDGKFQDRLETPGEYSGEDISERLMLSVSLTKGINSETFLIRKPRIV